MAWVRLDDAFTEHRKVLAAGPLAGWLWVCAIAWSNRNGTNGFVPWQKVKTLANYDGVGVYLGTFTGDDVDPQKLVDKLVDVGLLEDVAGGFHIHDYEQYQLTVEEIRDRSEAKKRAGRAGGLAAAQARATAAAQAESKPNPNPVPKVKPSSSAPPTGFVEWWSQYPRKVARQEAEKAYAKALRRADPAAILAGLQSHVAAWEHEQRPLDKIPHAATWLNNGRWLDDLTVPQPRMSDSGRVFHE